MRHRLKSAAFDDPDLVDRIFDYIVRLHPELSARHGEIKRAVREEFTGERAYVRRLDGPRTMAQTVLARFNGRNATEVARELRISRATVYRILKQPGAVS